MKKVALFLALICAAAASGAAESRIHSAADYDAFNRQAAGEYLRPVRPGSGNPGGFWNEYSTKFIYAPAFGFSDVDAAVSYRYTVTADTTAADAARFAPLTFTAATPRESLAPVWGEIPPGPVVLTVDALDSRGNIAGRAGERSFLRDYSFCGPYAGPARPYREAALKGMLYIHRMPQVQSWLTSDEPDMTYTYYAYANKIVSAVIRNECRVAANVPSERGNALAIARAAARFLFANSQGADAPLAYFPPTYYKGQMAGASDAGVTATMTMDACYTIMAMLDLFDATADSTYLTRATDITRTYAHLQRPDGSWPIKVSYLTGEPVAEKGAMLHGICMVCDRLQRQYGISEFSDMQRRAEEWMSAVPLTTFDLNAQFEDVAVEGLRPFENMTNYVAANYASYLLDKATPSAADIAHARELLQFCEDQFVHWDCTPDADGLHRYNTPCVVEQYKFRVPVDNSAANVAGALLRYYRVTGDTLSLAKARALIDNMTIQQHAQSGYLPTYWDYRPGGDDPLSMWANCALTVIDTLLSAQ